MTDGDGPPRLPAGGRGTRLWLLRHAEVDEGWRGIAYGDLDVPLGDEGRAVTRERGASFGALGPAAVLGSDLARARELARAVAERAGVDPRLDPRLREMHRGRWQGRRAAELEREHADEVEAYYADPWRWRGHGGECDADVFARAAPTVLEAVRDHPGATVVVCTHYNVLRVLAARALGVAPERSFALRVDPGRGLELHDAAFGWVLLHSNVTAPPPDDDPGDLTHPGQAAAPAVPAEGARP